MAKDENGFVGGCSGIGEYNADKINKECSCPR